MDIILAIIAIVCFLLAVVFAFKLIEAEEYDKKAIKWKSFSFVVLFAVAMAIMKVL